MLSFPPYPHQSQLSDSPVTLKCDFQNVKEGPCTSESQMGPVKNVDSEPPPRFAKGNSKVRCWQSACLISNSILSLHINV